MVSSTGGDDNVAPLPSQALRESVALPAEIIAKLADISGAERTYVWMQGAIAIVSPGKVEFHGFQRKDDLPPWIEGAVQQVVARSATTQDNLPVSLRSLPDPPQMIEAKRRMRMLGLHCASALRRWKRNGIEKKAALEAAAAAYSEPASTLRIWIKYANAARRERIQRLREALVRRWYQEKVELVEIARRLNVTPIHARRIRNFVMDGIHLEEANVAHP